MSEYLPIKESLGYRNVKQALWNVFSVNLDDIDIRGGEYEGFGFYLTYNNIAIHIGISDTEKGVQFQYGEGGTFDIYFPYSEDEMIPIVFLSEVISDKELSESVEGVFGKNEKDIEYAMQVLKDFLDSDDAKVLLKDE